MSHLLPNWEETNANSGPKLQLGKLLKYKKFVNCTNQKNFLQMFRIMCTIGGLGRYIGRYIGRLSTDYRALVGQQSTNCRPIKRPLLDGRTTDSPPICRSTIGRCIGRYVAINCRSTISQVLAKWQSSVSRVSTKYRFTYVQVLVKYPWSFGEVSLKYRWSIGRVSNNYRSSVGQASVMCQSCIGWVSTVEYCIGRHDYRAIYGSTVGRLSTDIAVDISANYLRNNHRQEQDKSIVLRFLDQRRK